MKYSKILVPTDFSKNADVAIKYAIKFAEQGNTQVVFFHSTCSLIPTSSSRDSYKTVVKKEIALKEELLKKEIEAVYHSLGVLMDDKRIRFEVKFGNSVVDNLLEVVEERKIDLVISSTKGATGLKKVFFGSNTVDIISKSPVPVMVIPDKFKYLPLHHIVYSTDLDHFDREIKEIKAFSDRFGIPFTVLNFAVGGLQFPEEIEKIKKIKSLGIPYIQKNLPIDQPLSTKLKNIMAKHKGSVLGMFKESRSGISRVLLGSTTEDLVFEPSFPLLIFKKEKVHELVSK